MPSEGPTLSSPPLVVNFLTMVVNIRILAYQRWQFSTGEAVMESTVILPIVDAALKGDPRAAQMAIRKFASTIRSNDQELYEQIVARLSSVAMRSVERGLRMVPVDADSRLNLVRVENPVELTEKPIHSGSVRESLTQIILERNNSKALTEAGLTPTKSIIFQGPPGVGKTLSARWLANQLNLPLLTLDLATVMSSFLGKTGNNIRSVLDHAASFPCVLLLDEFDAVAKRRDDERELGELKRLVTVLLQAIDDWPENSILIAATNHGELLDPAVWRRFDTEIEFTMPNREMIDSYINSNWPKSAEEAKSTYELFEGKSFSDISRILKKIKKESILKGLSIKECILEEKRSSAKELSLDEKKIMAIKLYKEGVSQRNISKQLGISRPTVKKALDEAKVRQG